MCVYHIWIDEDRRISITDENPETEGMCVTLVDGEIITDENEDDSERLDVEAMDAAMGAVIAKHDLNDPEQRVYLRQTFEDTKSHAEAKIARVIQFSSRGCIPGSQKR
jgi:hypothetical protein